jgi:thioester reductase-like protein
MSHVLITGATGTLGSAVLGAMLPQDEVRITLLLRANDQQQLDQRLRELSQFLDTGSGRLSAAKRVEAVRGDVCLPRLGLAPADWDRLTRTIGCVVHAAGNVRLNLPILEARRSAVDATQNVLEFVNECACRQSACKLEYVSTVGVAGKRLGLIPEKPLQTSAFHNTYEAAKAEAESLVLQALRHGLKATIHRPSMVVGDSVSGRVPHFQVFYHLGDFFAGLRTGGIVPDPGEVRLDLVPCDYVAAAICLSTRCAELDGRILHLCSGPHAAPRIRDLAETIRGHLSAHGRLLPKLRWIPLDQFQRCLPSLIDDAQGSTRRFLQALPGLLDYLEVIQLFDTTQTQALLSRLGLHVPSLDDYLPAVLSNYYQHSQPTVAVAGAAGTA